MLVGDGFLKWYGGSELSPLILCNSFLALSFCILSCFVVSTVGVALQLAINSRSVTFTEAPGFHGSTLSAAATIPLEGRISSTSSPCDSISASFVQAAQVEARPVLSRPARPRSATAAGSAAPTIITGRLRLAYSARNCAGLSSLWCTLAIVHRGGGREGSGATSSNGGIGSRQPHPPRRRARPYSIDG